MSKKRIKLKGIFKIKVLAIFIDMSCSITKPIMKQFTDLRVEAREIYISIL